MSSHSQFAAKAQGATFLTGGGVMGDLMRAHDWSATPLGVERWPQSLRTSVSTCLNSRFAIMIWWGHELVMLYNDACREIIGSKHPVALGHRGPDCFPEIWDVIGPMLDNVMSRGEATRSDDLLLSLDRSGYAEECYFTFSFGPIRDESGAVGGVFTPVQETTDKVIGARRLRTLQDLAARSRTARDVRGVCEIAAHALDANPTDVPFSAIYVYGEDGDCARLVARTGKAALPDVLRAPLVAGSGSGYDVRMAAGLPPDSAVVLPVATGAQAPGGYLLVGVNPRKRLDSSTARSSS